MNENTVLDRFAEMTSSCRAIEPAPGTVAIRAPPVSGGEEVGGLGYAWTTGSARAAQTHEPTEKWAQPTLCCQRATRQFSRDAVTQLRRTLSFTGVLVSDLGPIALSHGSVKISPSPKGKHS